jgi:hypothetical protein
MRGIYDCTARRYKEIIKKETEAWRMSRHGHQNESISPISVPYAWWRGRRKNRCGVVEQGGGRKREERKPQDGGLFAKVN